MFKNNGFRNVAFLVMVLALTGLACSGANLPFIATETPTPTMTFTPTVTFTPSPTSTPTQTPSPTPMPTGVDVQEQSDGSTLFIDYDNQYQFVIPTGWFVIPLSAEDIADILSDMSNENPELKKSAEIFSQLDPDVMRVIALNEETKYIYNGFSSNFSVTAVQDALMPSMPIEFVTGALQESLAQQGAKLVAEHEVVTNANGVEFGKFDFEQSAPTALGTKVQIRSRIIIFTAADKMIMFQLATPTRFWDELLPMMDDVANSLKLLEP